MSTGVLLTRGMLGTIITPPTMRLAQRSDPDSVTDLVSDPEFRHLALSISVTAA
jgi:hypothetical protein